MQPNEKGTQKDLVLYRIETSKSDIKAAEILLAAKEFRGANNRAYYGIYHAISAVHELDGILSSSLHFLYHNFLNLTFFIFSNTFLPQKDQNHIIMIPVLFLINLHNGLYR